MSATDEGSLSGEQYAISVDVEDYFQVWAFSDVVARDSWDGFQLRVGDNTRKCLDLFDAHSIKATFFTLGWVAERDPDLIRDIVGRGHELASHGYDHTKVNEQSPEQFSSDVQKTKAILEDIAGSEVNGYRAAGFSIGRDTPWAHELLARAGHTYSSSTHPISHDHYGDANASQSPYQPIDGHDFIEAPVATVQFLGKRMSAAGGGWFRAAPAFVSNALIKKASASLKGPAIFYFHPWEIDPDQPRLTRASFKSKFRHYLNLKSMERKLSGTLSAFPWKRIDESLTAWKPA